MQDPALHIHLSLDSMCLITAGDEKTVFIEVFILYHWPTKPFVNINSNKSTINTCTVIFPERIGFSIKYIALKEDEITEFLSYHLKEDDFRLKEL